MKKGKLLVIVLMLLVASGVFAKGTKIKSVYDTGDLTVFGSVGFGYGLSIALYPGVEMHMSQARIGDVLPLDFGLSGRGFFNSYSVSGLWGWTAFGIGAYGMAHLSFQEFDLPSDFFDKLDFYIGLGIKFDIYKYTGSYLNYYGATSSYGGLGFSTVSGFNYFFNDNFALMLEGNYWGNYGGGTVGILYKF